MRYCHSVSCAEFLIDFCIHGEICVIQNIIKKLVPFKSSKLVLILCIDKTCLAQSKILTMLPDTAISILK